MNLLDLLQIDGFTVKRVATTNGGEYAGACPSCGGRDRFRVWPEEDGGRFWCRGCGKHGDAIQFLRDFRGLSFQEACLELGRDMTKHKPKMSPIGDRPKPSPSLKWQQKARAFLERAQGALKTPTVGDLEWLRGRGLKPETIEGASLGWNPVDLWEPRQEWGLEPLKDEKGRLKKLWLPGGLVIPLVKDGAVIRLRIRRTAGEPRYVIVSGSDTRPLIFPPWGKCFVIVESELDGLLISQEAGDIVGTVALGTATAKPDQELNGLLKGASRLLIALDFDEAGARAAWRYWLETYPNAKRWPVPKGKDPSDYFQQGGNVRAWIEAGLTRETVTVVTPTAEAMIKPFPKEWLEKYAVEQLERLSIMTVCGGLSDTEALRLLN